MDGRAWSFACEGDDEKFVAAIESLIKKPIPVHKVASSSSPSSKRGDEKRSQEKPKKHSKSTVKKEKSSGGSASDTKGFGDDVPAFFS